LSAHDRKNRAGDVHRAKHRGLDLCPEVLGSDLLKENGAKVARIVDEDVDPVEPVDGGARGVLGVGEAGDVELDGQEVVASSESRGDSLRVAPGADDGVTRGQGSLHNVDAQAPARAGNEPDLLVKHASPLRFRPS